MKGTITEKQNLIQAQKFYLKLKTSQTCAGIAVLGRKTRNRNKRETVRKARPSSGLHLLVVVCLSAPALLPHLHKELPTFSPNDIEISTQNLLLKNQIGKNRENQQQTRS